MEIYRFGLFELDAEGGELRRDGLLQPLQEQPLALLLLLLRHRGEVVSREEIRQTLWPPEVHLEFANSLNAAVSRLRDALGDTASQPRYIVTVPRKGYRFIAPVEVVLGSSEPASQATPGGTSDAMAEVVGRAVQGKPRRGVVRAAVWVVTVLVVTALAVTSAWLFSPSSANRSPTTNQPTPSKPIDATKPIRLAVLPITTLSSEGDRDFIGDGLTEELIGRLGALRPDRLAVIARTSVMPYKGSGAGVQQIAADLDADYLLEGTLRHQQDVALITLRLIRVADQSQLWQRQFERRLVDFFALQRTVSEDVAASLALQLLEVPSQGNEPGGTSNAEAYELFLKGQFLLNQRTRQSIEKALEAFQRAAELDPEYVSTQVGIAQGWILAGTFDAVLPRQAEARAMVAVDRVLEMEPGHSAGLLARAFVRFAFGWRWQEAEEDFLAVLERSPNLAEAHQAYASLLLSQGRFDGALAQLDQALDLDPMSLVLRTERCWYLFYARRFEDAAASCRETLELDPGYVHAQDNLKWILIRAGEEEAAQDAFLRLLVLEGEDETTLQYFRKVAQKDGLQGMLAETIHYRAERAAEDPDSVVPYDQALDAAAADRRQLALEWLGKSFDRRETDLMFLAVDPRFDSLRQELAFQELLRRIREPGISASAAP